MATPATSSTIPSLFSIATVAVGSLSKADGFETLPHTSPIVLATSLATAVSLAATSTATSTPRPRPGEDENTGECKLLGPFAVLVQAALGLLALLSLVFKRWRERPQRPVKVWAFDASKQVFGSALLHLANLLMSLFSAGQIQASLAKAAADTVGTTEAYRPNPCSFYLINLAIDTTIGIPILIVILKVLNIGASYTPLAKPPESIQSGHYGDPPQATWWLKQSMIYFFGLLGMKVCVFIIFYLLPWIGRVGDWALKWTEGNEAVQITFVMFIFPLIMNGVQYYIIDIFIKKKMDEKDHSEAGVRDGDESEHGGLLAQDNDGHGNSIEEDEACKGSDPKSYDVRINRDHGQETGQNSSPASIAEHHAMDDRLRSR